MQNQQNNYCRNCFYPLDEADKFCSNCAQKNTDGKITVKSLVSEFFSTLFNLDSKIFRTLRDLMVPGKLTIEYFKGKHKRYVHPIRLFLVTILALIAITFYFSGDNDEILDIQMGTDRYELPKVKEEITQKNVLKEINFYKDTLLNQKTSLESLVVLDSLNDYLKRKYLGKEDSIQIGEIGLHLTDDLNFSVAKKDYAELSTKELIEKYKVEGFSQQWLFAQNVKVLRDNNEFGRFFLRNMVWTLFFMMPFLALLLRLFYYKRGKYYVEYLIFSFHTHAFTFLITIVIFLFAMQLDWGEEAILATCMAILFYLFFALWRVYGQGFWLTVFKVLMIAFCYILLFSFFIVLSVFIGMFFF